MTRRGFFAGSQIVSKPPPSRLPQCGACRLNRGCVTPNMPIRGKGRRGILIVAEAPTASDDEEGHQIEGAAGKYLRNALMNLGVDLYEDCWKTSALICRPPKSRAPTDAEIEHCRPNLMNTIERLKPIVIICLGEAAVRSLIGRIWKEQVGPITRWEGWTIPCQQLNTWICPTYHPAYCLRENDECLDRTFQAAIERACDKEQRPFETVPDEKADVDLIYDPNEAAKIIRKMIKRKGAVAFDYETNRLKPDEDNAVIVSCSVSWRGDKTIAYPWHGEAIKATRELLRSPLPKIASNIKFEERWSRTLLKTRVRNWVWDTMVSAHIIDNRPAITSIKFQSFILLGSDIWDDHIQQFLRTKDGNVNQILEQIDMKDLLLYNGLDSLLEYRVAVKQMQLLNYPIPKGMI